MVYVQTTAYNAEKTLSRAVDSVLNQTYGDFLYYICDNGSTDKTGKIIRKYAKKDRRIVASYNKQNRDYSDNREFMTLRCDLREEDYYCSLDADDEYALTFLEDVIGFMQKNNLDIGCCGYDVIDAASKRKIANHVVESDLIIEGETFSTHVPIYFQFMRATWGKVYRGNVSKVQVVDRAKNPDFPNYGADTANVMLSFQASKRVGILSKTLHKYYSSKKSVSYKLDNERIADDRRLYDRVLGFLRHFNGLTPHNEDFLLLVYFYAINDTLNLLLTSGLSGEEKLAGIIDIFSHEYTKRVIASQKIGALIGQPEAISRQKQSLFSGIIEKLITAEQVPDELMEKFCDVGEMLSAAVEYAAGFILFKKLRARYFMAQNRVVEARAAIDELAELLPNDEDIINMKRELLL
jgi:glycosyltransferase involved in cell wall biosynthesis